MRQFGKGTRRGVCLVISAPSGAGKSTIARLLRESDPTLETSISVTTRLPRPGEKNGVHYHFRTREQFEVLLKEDGLIEWAEVFGNFYGTPRMPLEHALSAGRDVILDVDWQGHRLLRRAFAKDVVGLFILPPSLKELEKRLQIRLTDPEEVINQRMARAMDEINHWQEFDYVMVNDDLKLSVRQAKSVLEAARMAVKRRTDLLARIETAERDLSHKALFAQAGGF